MRVRALIALLSINIAGLFISGCGGGAASTPPPAAPQITAQPISQSITAGQSATFSVTAAGTAPLSYQWNKNGAAISGATTSSYSTPPATAADNGAQFNVVVSNTKGNVTSGAATLTVTGGSTAPSIVAQPANQTVMAGQSATFSVTAAGTAPLSYQWSENGIAISGATSAAYTTPPTTTADNGAQFTVAISNALGNVTSAAATLTVNPGASAPTITAQPCSQTVTAGEPASFSVTATGTAPLSYQWRKNSSAVTGATSPSYATPATTAADNGALFDVVVSNATGSATSQAATLTVTAATVVKISTTTLPNGIVQAAYSTTLQATGGTLPYTWSVASGQLPAGLTLSASGIISGTPTAAGLAIFTIQAADSLGNTAVAGFLLTTGKEVGEGFVDPQTGAPFTNASLSGAISFGTTDQTEQSVTDYSGIATFNGLGAVSGTTDSNALGSAPSSNAFSQAYSISNGATGRGTVTSNGATVSIFYIIATSTSTHVVQMDAGDITGAINSHPAISIGRL